MTLQEARDFIKQWSHWNAGQVSFSMAFSKIRTVEDDILDSRRAILLNAYKIVQKDSESHK